MHDILPFRGIHLDFHTSPLIPDVGAEFDPDEFGDTLAAAHINHITCFAKCHHGLSYYDTAVGTKHPSLKRDLLGEQVAACRARGIRINAYVTVVWDELSASRHPDWLQVDRNGRLAGRGPLDTHGWRCICLNSPALDLLEAHSRELLEKYDLAGFFYDIFWQIPDGCYCDRCCQTAAGRGIDVRDAEGMRQLARDLEREAMERLTAFDRALRPDVGIFYNGQVKPDMAARAHFFSHVEIESLPSGGWGYDHFPLYARYVQTLGRDALSHTGRFHKSWGDFGGIKNRAAMEYECFRMIAHGCKAMIGDQLHPRGRLEPATYRRIGEVFGSIAEKEAWCAGADPVQQIAAVWTPSSGHGVMRVLMELHHQFQMIEPTADLSPYELVILPDDGAVDGVFAARLRDHLAGGGKLLVTGHSALDAEAGRFVLEEMGVTYQGESEYANPYLRLNDAILGDTPDLDHVLYERPTGIAAQEGAEVLGWLTEPYFDRNCLQFMSHAQTPYARRTEQPLIVQKGPVIYVAWAIFKAYYASSPTVYRDLLERLIGRLVPQPVLRATLPHGGEATLFRQNRRLVAHLLYYVPERRGNGPLIVEDVVPLRGVRLSMRCTQEPTRASLAPQEENLPVAWDGTYAHVVVPEMCGHQMVVFEDAVG